MENNSGFRGQDRGKKLYDNMSWALQSQNHNSPNSASWAGIRGQQDAQLNEEISNSLSHKETNAESLS